jgi:hypothetical protein
MTCSLTQALYSILVPFCQQVNRVLESLAVVLVEPNEFVHIMSQ